MNRSSLSLDDIDLGEHLSDPELLMNTWTAELEEAIKRRKYNIATEAFSIAAIRLYRDRNYQEKRPGVKDISSVSGYSRSTFFRNFETLAGFQLWLYNQLGELVLEVLQQKTSGCKLPPDDYCALCAKIIYSSHAAVPERAFRELLLAHRNLDHEQINRYIDKGAATIHAYIVRNQELGYAQRSLAEVREVVRLLDFDIFYRRKNAPEHFPSLEQAKRLSNMLLGFFKLNSLS